MSSRQLGRPGRRVAARLLATITALALVAPSPARAAGGPSPVALIDPRPPETASGDWAMFHGSTDRVGVNPDETILDPTTVRDLTLKWSFSTGGQVWSSPAVALGVAYVGSDDGNLYAIDAGTGTELWRFQTGGAVRSSPAVVDGVVYVGSDDYRVYAIDAATGARIWRWRAAGKIELSSPLVANGLVFVGSLDGHLYALDQATGTEVWAAYLWAVRGSAAISGNTLFVGSDRSLLYALNATTGAVKWSAHTGGRIRSTPAVRHGVVYVGADDYRVYAFNTSDGSLKWRSNPFPNSGIVRTSPAVVNSKVYVATGETSPMGSHFYILSQADGSQICDHQMADYATSSVAVSNGVAYVGSFSHQLYAFDANTCDKLWDSGFTAMKGGIRSSPAVSGGSVYVGSLDGSVYSFDVAVGPPVGTFVSITDDLYSPQDAIGHDIGKAVQWTNLGAGSHSVTDSTGMDLFDSGPMPPGGAYTFPFVAAGIYSYQCTVVPAMTGTIKAPMVLSPDTGTVDTAFTIQWATDAPPEGFVYDVKIQRPRSTGWTLWQDGVSTTSTTFVPDSGTGTYSFKAHIRETSTGSTARYSAAQSITVS